MPTVIRWIMFLCLHNGRGAIVCGGNNVIIISRIEGVLRARNFSLSRIIILNRMQNYVMFCGITPLGYHSRIVFCVRICAL